MTPPARSGRRTSQRGQKRRQLLLDAAGELLRDEGFAAVSHRSVAQRAGLPLSATTYYFVSLDELVHEAVRDLANTWLVAASEVVAQLPPTLTSPQQLVDVILRVVALGPEGGRPADSKAVLTMYERYLEAARHPRLRPVIDQYDDHLDSLLVEVLRRGDLPYSRGTARLVLAVVDGALLRALAEGLPVTSATAPLHHLLQALAQGRADTGT